MQPLQQPMVQCLDLSRPDSISTAGYCADVVTQATRYPQPMLYSPAKGALVTNEPPGRSGVEQLQWLDSLSRPKHVTTKSPKAVPQQTCSPQQQRPQPGGIDQQQQQQPPGSQQPPQPSQQQQQSHLSGLPPEAAAAVERSTLKAEHAAAQAAFSAACQSERRLVSYPQSFSWGGRVKGKHSSLCRMNAGVQSVGSGTTQPHVAAGNPPAASKKHCAGGADGVPSSPDPPAAAAGMLGGQRNTNTSSSSPGQCHDASNVIIIISSSIVGTVAPQDQPTGPSSGTAAIPAMRARTKGLLGADVAASAAQLGANADRLLAVLDRRKQKQQHKGPAPMQQQQQQQQRIRQGGSPQAAPVHGAGMELHSLQDEPLCTAGQDYLRL